MKIPLKNHPNPQIPVSRYPYAVRRSIPNIRVRSVERVMRSDIGKYYVDLPVVPYVLVVP